MSTATSKSVQAGRHDWPEEGRPAHSHTVWGDIFCSLFFFSYFLDIRVSTVAKAQWSWIELYFFKNPGTGYNTLGVKTDHLIIRSAAILCRAATLSWLIDLRKVKQQLFWWAINHLSNFSNNASINRIKLVIYFHVDCATRSRAIKREC